MTVEAEIDDPRDQFPIGMRVLAVDDDPTCLFLLEKLLRRCQYHVTTTNQAIKALNMLRENKDQFDLVISDVQMPDMDGFKLLELVGLEMDLPVIMLSINGDTKLVMKGITHGACDYLLKPVRIEELKNIWQHVIRRKKFDSKDKNNCGNQEKLHSGSVEGGPGSAGTLLDQNGKLNKKRKDQDEEEVEEHDENGPDNDDPSNQKKPRVVWSVDLHRKFVAAVNQLGIDKAVPKKILDLMNVEKLTRENVASHLQKYRLYLKRISCVANQQANMVAALGGTDASFLQMSSLNGVGNFQTLNGSGQFHNTAFRSFPPNGMLGRLSTPAGLGIHGLSSSGMTQLGHSQNSGSSTIDQVNFQQVIIPGNHNGSVLQGMPMSLQLDQLQNNKSLTRVRELSTAVDNTTVFPISSGLPDARMTIGSSSNPLLGVTNNTLMLEGAPQGAQTGKVFGNHSSVSFASLNSELSSPLPDHRRLNDNWSTAQSSGIQSNSFSLNDTFKQDLRADVQCRTNLISSNAGQVSNNAPAQRWDDHDQDGSYHSNVMCSSINSMIPVNGTVGPLGQNLEPKNTIFHTNMDFNSMEQSNFIDPLYMNHNEVNKSTMETSLKLKQGLFMDQRKPQGSFISASFGSLEDIVSAMAKQEQDKLKLIEGDFGCDPYSLGTCM
ncbi:hypothetical protein CMV_010213 [Castanea mollissima]|uniref:Two-component response regulator n=1 Tax=Castanea mollissima TaxID=60419 RepID=A0A8J4VM53_9ROSI|nr:hypothetical protein CMV_010213 [Castanea mollissima]